jgi:hypothetical protein
VEKALQIESKGVNGHKKAQNKSLDRITGLT